MMTAAAPALAAAPNREHERQLAAGLVPHGDGGVGEQDGRVRTESGRQQRRRRLGRKAQARRDTGDVAERRRRVVAPWPTATQVPTLIGDLSLNTRIMLRNRAGRPRSAIRSGGLRADRRRRDQRRVAGEPLVAGDRAASPSSDEAPASPPVKKYQRSSRFQTGALTIGRP